jgi:hypothetical protein
MRTSLLYVACAVVNVACASTTGVGHARVLKDSESQLTFGGELGAGLAKLSPGQPAPGPWGEAGLGYRRGIFGFEAGARVWGFGLPNRFFTLGAAADLKYPLIAAPTIHEGFDLSLGLDLGYHQINMLRVPAHIFFVQVPLTFGVNIGGGDQAIIGLRVVDQVMTGHDVSPVNMFFLGGSLGFSWRALSDVGLDIRPELVVLHSPVPFNGLVEDERRRGLTIVQIGLNNALAL